MALNPSAAELRYAAGSWSSLAETLVDEELFDAAVVAPVVVTSPSISGLVDGFDTLDTTLWAAYGTAGLVTVASSALHVRTATEYPFLLSKNKYSLKGTSLTLDLPNAGRPDRSVSASSEFIISLGDVAGNSVQFVMTADPLYLISRTQLVTTTAGTSVLTDAFSGATGSAWDTSKWMLGLNPAAGGGATVVNGIGRLTTGTAGGYSGNDKVGRSFNTSNRADVDLRLDFKSGADNMSPQVYVRSSNSGEPGANSYLVGDLVAGRAPALYKLVNYSSTSLATSATVLTADTWYSLRFQANGSTVRGRVWVQGATEPAAWNIGSVTDTSLTAAGYAGVMTGAGQASQIFDIDNVELSTPGTSTTTSTERATASPASDVRYFRLAESSGLVTALYSADYASWTTLGTAFDPSPLDLGNVEVKLQAGRYTATDPEGEFNVLGVNTIGGSMYNLNQFFVFFG